MSLRCGGGASTALLARHWPKQSGSRHELALGLGGLLLRGGLSDKVTSRIVRTAARIAGDNEAKDRVQAVRDTAKRLAKNKPVKARRTVADLMGNEVVDRLRDWLGLKSAASNGSSQHGGPYRVQGGCIAVERTTRDGPVVVPLCNFEARVTEEVTLDDSADTTRAFVLEGKLESGEVLPAVRVPATRFSGMAWVTDCWGLRAVVRAGLSMRDQLREAIQRLSPSARRRQVFTHTGWRQIGEEWFYLTATGAVGRDGFEVDVGNELARYQLPRVADDPVEAMRASLRLLEVAPLTVGRTQGRAVEAERPSRRFLRVLLALVTQDRAALLPKDSYDQLTSRGPLVGWQDEDSIYLIPDAAFQAVVRFCRDSGEPFPMRQQRLMRDLAQENLSECDPGRHTTTARVGGGTRRVLCLRRAAVEDLLGEQFPEVLGDYPVLPPVV